VRSQNELCEALLVGTPTERIFAGTSLTAKARKAFVYHAWGVKHS
jgi:hypothetical protein